MRVKADQQILLSIILKFFHLNELFLCFFPELKRRRQMFFRISKQLVSLSDKIEILCDIYYSI